MKVKPKIWALTLKIGKQLEKHTYFIFFFLIFEKWSLIVDIHLINI